MSLKNTNDGTQNIPYLSTDLNFGTLSNLPDFSVGPKLDKDEEEAVYQCIKNAGYTGVQGGNFKICQSLNLKTYGGGKVDQASEAEPLAKAMKENGHACATLHVGFGMEDDSKIDSLVDAIINASVKHDFPLYIETHRATVTQDIWRTVELTKRFSEVRFNGDFSHWYTGLEMVYGNIEEKFNFLNPVFERTRFIHARIGNPGCIQVDIGDGKDLTYVEHFKEMWTRSMVGFLKSAQPGDYLSFNPEILQPRIYYARTFPDQNGKPREESDRWQQAIVYTKIAKECWVEAERRMGI